MKYGKDNAININKLLNKKTYDFIFLQEVANKKKLLKDLDSNYNIITHKSGPENIVSLINKKYKITKILGGQFISGRPFLVILLTNNLLTNNLCLINVHLPHITNLDNELKKISNYLLNNNINLTNYRIIFGGDFNIVINKNIKFMNKKLYTSTKYNTCCGSTLKYKFDYILDSDNKILETKLFYPQKNKIMLPSSDHLGIYTKINK
jgi:endonuclease/exonuclease/phosphatase family metal-dependent hydrolase